MHQMSSLKFKKNISLCTDLNLHIRIYLLIFLSLMIFNGCGPTGGSDSPSNSVKDFVAALKEQNPGRAWNYLSAGSQKMYNDIAKNRNQSGKEYFEKSVSNMSSLGM